MKTIYQVEKYWVSISCDQALDLKCCIGQNLPQPSVMRDNVVLLVHRK